ncbi:hypothetical protein [Sandaracinus amylolyticus]|uniref:hypothetical protein n=1 Tax=Sandaracinus amylolyticus TaxID=927083 RepID=UPI001F21172D|nr:hypothetical protein [Sandaracinus amylolyticus]UJR86449.1 Hypothetical protein I5071_85440 [Sandaracinus amylolyticus]
MHAREVEHIATTCPLAPPGRGRHCRRAPIDETDQRVWDVLHEHAGGRTTMRVGSHHELRLDPTWVAERARAHGLGVDELAPHRGMTVQRLRKA